MSDKKITHIIINNEDYEIFDKSSYDTLTDLINDIDAEGLKKEVYGSNILRFSDYYNTEFRGEVIDNSGIMHTTSNNDDFITELIPLSDLINTDVANPGGTFLFTTRMYNVKVYTNLVHFAFYDIDRKFITSGAVDNEKGDLEKTYTFILEAPLFTYNKAHYVRFCGNDGADLKNSYVEILDGKAQSRITKNENRIDDLQVKSKAVFDGNMNECLEQGIYPWCTLGRPAGEQGAFTVVVRKSSTPDNNGFYTVEQTAYGRAESSGKVYKRVLFTKPDGTVDYMNWINCTGGVNKLAFSGILKCDSVTQAEIDTIMNSLAANEQAWYLAGNSSGAATGGTVTFNSVLAKLVHSEDSRGVAANLGDFICFAKDANGNKLYRVIPVNDAKAPNGNFPGTYGILTPNDRMDIDNAMMQTWSESNMNNALNSGFYPYCTTGRPAGSEDGDWYTCVVQRSRQVDGNGFFSVMQTCYLRRSDKPTRIFTRLIFYKPTNRAEDNYGEWTEVSGGGTTGTVDYIKYLATEILEKKDISGLLIGDRSFSKSRTLFIGLDKDMIFPVFTIIFGDVADFTRGYYRILVYNKSEKNISVSLQRQVNSPRIILNTDDNNRAVEPGDITSHSFGQKIYSYGYAIIEMYYSNDIRTMIVTRYTQASSVPVINKPGYSLKKTWPVGDVKVGEEVTLPVTRITPSNVQAQIEVVGSGCTVSPAFIVDEGVGKSFGTWEIVATPTEQNFKVALEYNGNEVGSYSGTAQPDEEPLWKKYNIETPLTNTQLDMHFANNDAVEDEWTMYLQLKLSNAESTDIVRIEFYNDFDAHPDNPPFEAIHGSNLMSIMNIEINGTLLDENATITIRMIQSDVHGGQTIDVPGSLYMSRTTSASFEIRDTLFNRDLYKEFNS